MRGIIHPFTRARYELIEDGRIRVTLGDQRGLFTGDGRWLEGELRECDAHLCGWIAGPQVANHRVGDAARPRS